MEQKGGRTPQPNNKKKQRSQIQKCNKETINKLPMLQGIYNGTKSSFLLQQMTQQIQVIYTG